MNSVFKSALKEHRKLIQLNPEKPIRKSDVYWHIEEVGALVHRYAKYFLLCLIIFDGIAIFNTGKSILLIVTSSVVSSYEPWDAR